eukprot:TRINITY_DN5612_c0_g2_i10.p1 TRINITY_DN5612_c0_g2~~TRINITY_DN5612_c0_g2_i10.p1  ORF type:complete len:112 (+),score=11.64 TRINITY_DN5612_c0_g2_i10:1013-1348(+)
MAVASALINQGHRGSHGYWQMVLKTGLPDILLQGKTSQSCWRPVCSRPSPTYWKNEMEHQVIFNTTLLVSLIGTYVVFCETTRLGTQVPPISPCNENEDLTYNTLWLLQCL